MSWRTVYGCDVCRKTIADGDTVIAVTVQVYGGREHLAGDAGPCSMQSRHFCAACRVRALEVLSVAMYVAAQDVAKPAEKPAERGAKRDA